MSGTGWFLLVIGAVVVAFVAYGVARRARGSIEVTLPTSNFEPGETVRGEVAVHAKKPIEAERLVVTVTATEVTEARKGGETDRTSEQVYRGEQVLHEVRSYAAGTRESYAFAIDLPNRTPTPAPAPAPDSLGGKMASKKLMAAKTTTTQLQWRLSVRLVAKGIDLGTSRALTVNIDRL